MLSPNSFDCWKFLSISRTMDFYSIFWKSCRYWMFSCFRQPRRSMRRPKCSSRSFATFRLLVHFAPQPITPFLVCKLEFLLHEAVSPLSHVLNPPSDCVQAPGYHVFLEEIQPCPIPCILQALLNYIIISLYSPIS